MRPVGGFAAAHCGKPLAYRWTHFIDLRLRRRCSRRSLEFTVKPIAGKAEPFRYVLGRAATHLVGVFFKRANLCRLR